MSSEEIVPDLTVKSASSTNILTRFPSDLLETSVDPDNDVRDAQSSEAPNVSPKTKNPKLGTVSTSEEVESFEHSIDVICSHSTPFTTDGNQDQSSTNRDIFKPIECNIDSAKSHEINQVLAKHDNKDAFNGSSSIFNSANTEDKEISQSSALATKNVHITTSTLETTNNSTELTALIVKSNEINEKPIETSSINIDNSIPSYNKLDKMKNANNSSEKRAFEEYDEKGIAFPTSNIKAEVSQDFLTI